jgi:polysaccharide pyruvyl transferase CsaB
MSNISRKKIIISGYYGFDNFGDEAILHVLVRELKKHIEDVEITVLSKNPQATSKNFSVKSIDRMNFYLIVKELFNADLLISGGGSLLQDVTSKLTIYYYLFIIFLAQQMKVKTCIFAQGIGPISRKFSKYWVKTILKKTDCCMVRDSDSQTLLESLGVKSILSGDPVWLGLESNYNEEILLNDLEININQKYIGINLRPWKGIGMLELQDLARCSANFAHQIDADIIIMPLQLKQDLEMSQNFYNLLMTVAPELNVIFINKTLSPVEWNTLFKHLEAVIAMRFHAQICALLNKKKLFGISYDPKVETLMKTVKTDYATIQNWREKKIYELMQNWSEKRKLEGSYNTDFNNLHKLAGQNIENVIKLLQ